MIFKLALSSMRSRLKDYIVLLLGLVMSISIFYMFETLALNKAFIQENAMINAVGFVFQAGSILLAIITIAYVLYANSFLFSLRQKEFGMYMTLGAKKRKISLIMFIETMFIGLISLVIGILLGTGLASVIGKALMNQLEFHSNTYAPFYLPSLIITFVFFAILFILSAFTNILQISKVTVLSLVHGDAKAEKVIIRKKAVVVKAILSIILLVIGYYCMIRIETTQYIGIIVALFTITFGTYLFFATFLPLLIQKRREKQILKSKRLNSFTYAQLNFRISQLTRVLATVAMLIALGMGAIAVGFAFQNNGPLLADRMDPYDIKIVDPTVKEKQETQNMTFKEEVTYHFKQKNNTFYFNIEELNQNPILAQTYSKDGKGQTKRLKAFTNGNRSEWDTAIYSAFPPSEAERNFQFVSAADFSKVDGKSGAVYFGKTTGFVTHLEQLKKIDELQHDRYGDNMAGSKYSAYKMYSSFASGTVFMGFFLGFAFLTMMASCLMFKILTGATQDIRRYAMLEKIGVRERLLKQSIYKEMFLIFLFPCIIGFIHVALGMKMFGFLLINPYYHFYVPILLFLGIYCMYYFITVTLYKGIVLKKETLK
ncbi:ABC transporter permease [Listeria fleischmannii]|uniref:ABC transporter permease n=1 Tax=Listeria fleischmannii TaxID=1069827 RepID=A0A841YBG6_9LIST|nr:ABC transporter permease [Listeria fleischmannii]EIA20688.1 ABC transporter permease [Listeria fleischmannii subsp. coloradonensis]MBC1397600.1 ABC transporter permease [Listeria fleischmannii]MBC1426859.1 ABC transporter permease [Listeria fleischmannii]STY33682.1 FtsX-like permease family [Listeria fleischmannii subsp. coloradonensis]